MESRIIIQLLVVASSLFCCLRIADAGSGRYKSCSEGCCAHEICLHKKICYPDAGCSFGCPDGTCDVHLNRCRPPKPCSNNFQCGIGHACTHNYNLGYSTCQYDLQIGSTLCKKRRRNTQQ